MGILMDRGARTKGRAARAVAGTEAVEVKATVPSHQVGAALARLAVAADETQRRFVYFFDTPELSLLEAGIVARARRRVGGQHDSTVKVRPVDPDAVPRRWRKHEGFKLESDASDKGAVRSASLTSHVAKGLIKAVAAGTAPVHELFSSEQLDFLHDLTDVPFDPDALSVFGPVEAFRWKFGHEAVPWPVTAELWRRPDGTELLEVSARAPAAQAAVAYYGFIGYLAELGAEHDPQQRAKTRWAMEFFASRLREPAAAGG